MIILSGVMVKICASNHKSQIISLTISVKSLSGVVLFNTSQDWLYPCG